MTHFKRAAYCAVLLVALFTQACKKDNTTIPVANNSAANVISKIENNYGITEVSYNADTTINKIVYTSATNGNSTAQFSYENGLLKKIEQDNDLYIYSYTNSQVTEILYLYRGDVSNKYLFNYTGNDVSEQVSYIVSSNGGFRPEEKVLYTYYKPGNVNKSSFYIWLNNAWVKSADEIITSYDDHPNYSDVLNAYPYLPYKGARGNNPLVKEVREASGALAYSTDYTYTYDAQGKPKTRQLTNKTGGQVVNVINNNFTYKY